MVSLLAMAAVLLTLNTDMYSYGQIGIQPGRVLYYLQPVNFPAQAAPNNCTQCFTRTGTKGPRGLRGPVGPIGPPGRINETLMDNLQQQMRELIKTLASIQAENVKMKAEIAQIKDQQRCRGVRFEGRCYFVLDGRNTFDGSKTACDNVGATFAPIVNVGVYDAVEGYLREKLIEEGASGSHFRIALTFDPSRGVRYMTTLDGTRVTLDKWYSGHPKSARLGYSAYTSVIWYVYTNPASTGYFINVPTTSSYSYRPVCVISM